MTVDPGIVETIDAPLQPAEEELLTLLGRRGPGEDEAVAAEAVPPAPDSEYFTAPAETG